MLYFQDPIRYDRISTCTYCFHCRAFVLPTEAAVDGPVALPHAPGCVWVEAVKVAQALQGDEGLFMRLLALAEDSQNLARYDKKEIAAVWQEDTVKQKKHYPCKP